MRRNATIYFTSYALSLLGNGIASVVMPLLVLARTGDVLAAGIVASVTAATAAVAGIFAGVVIDRVNRRTVSIVSDLLSASAVATLPIVDALWGLNMIWFVVLAIVGAFGDAPGMTARETLLPRVVELAGERPGLLDRMVGAREALAGVLLLAGPGVGGLLIALFGVESVTLLFTASTSLAAAIVTCILDRRVGVSTSSRRGDKLIVAPASLRAVWRDLRAGWRFLFMNRLVLGVTMLTAVFIASITALQTTLMPAYFTAEGHPALTGMALSGISVTGFIGAGIYAASVGKISRRKWFVIGMIGSVIGAIGLGTLSSPWMVLVAAAFIGLTNGPVSAALGVAMIEATPDGLRGRVLGAQNAITLGAPALATAPFGAVASAWGLATAGVVFAGVIALTVIVALAAPTFRNLDHPRPARQDVREEE